MARTEATLIPALTRRARPTDERALAALLARCSPDTLYRRFHGAVGSAVKHEVRRMANPTGRHRSWVVIAGGEIRGTATLAWGSDGVVEAAFLVEDAWARRGMGERLFQAIAEEARRIGVAEVTAWVQGDNEPARRFLRAMAPDAQMRFAGYGELEVTMPFGDARRPSITAAAPLRRTA